MKYKLIFGACWALLPVLVGGQTLQVKDCKTLEAAGNYIGADEELVDGKVCKVVKTKPALTNAAPGEAVPASSTTLQPQGSTIQGNSVPAQNATFEPDRAPSVADVARAYRKPPRKPIIKARQGAAPASDATAVAKEAKPTAPTGEAPAATAAAKVQPTVPAQPAVPTPAPEMQTTPEIKIEPAPAPSVPVKVATTKAQAATPAQAPEPQATPEIKIESAPAASVPTKPSAVEVRPATTTPAPEAQATPEIKTESAPAASVAAAARMTEVQPTAPTPVPATESNKAAEVAPQEPKTGTFDQQEVARAEVKPEVQPALPETVAAEEERPREVKTGEFAAPKETGEAKPTVVDPFGVPPEDAGIQEPRPDCRRVVSLGSMQVDRLVLGTPDWAARWLEKNQKRFPGLCFADSPLEGVPSYLIVFSVVAPPPPAVAPPRTAQGAQTLAPTKVDAAASTPVPPSGGTYTTSFGSTWHYSYDNAPTTTVTTAFIETIPHNLPTRVISATAYSEEGIPISQHWPTETAAKGREKEPSHGRGHKQEPLPLAVRLMIDLLEQMMADIVQR